MVRCKNGGRGWGRIFLVDGEREVQGCKESKRSRKKTWQRKGKKKALTRTDVAVRKVSRSNVGGAKEQRRRQKEEGRENPSPRFIKRSEVMGHV